MRRALVRIAPVLHLTRVTTAFAVVANTWFVILWTRASPDHEPGAANLPASVWAQLAAGALVGLGLFGFGTALNDILDLKRDRTLHPARPLAAGRISMESAIGLVVLTMMAAILGATAFGTGAVLLTLALHGAILGFNAAARFVPAVGLVVLGLIYAGHMVVPNVQLRFLWPVWAVMTHALAVGAVTHWMARKVPRLSRRAVVAAVAGWVFWSVVILGLQWRRETAAGGGATSPLWPDWVPISAAVWPVLLALLFVLVAWGKVKRYGFGPRAAEKINRYGSLWLALYACAWLLGAEHTGAGLLLVGLAAAGFLGMTVLREVYGILEQPIRYRR